MPHDHSFHAIKEQGAAQNTLTGYMSPLYGQSFRHAGEILTLPQSGLQLLRREIQPGVCDLVGLYPYSMCWDFAALAGPEDQAALQATGSVALSFVADPFEADTVHRALGHWPVCRQFKTQFVIDLSDDWRSARSKTIRNYVRKGYEAQTTKTVVCDRDFAPQFWALYQNSIRRLKITGIPRMSQAMIADQMEVPGAFLTLARDGATLNGAMISFVHRTHANAHLISYNEQYSSARTSYVLIDTAAAHAEALGCNWFNIGGPAGMEDNSEDGLYQFKRRWTKSTRATTLCGLVLDARAYAELCAETGAEESNYFPAYRRPGSPYEWRPAL